MKALIILILSLFFISCKTKKDYQLQQIKSSYQVKSDSLYIDSITGHITTLRAYTINFDSTGKPSSATINESVKEAKKQVKSGQVTKDEKKSESIKNEAKKVDREGFNINYIGLIITLLVVVGIIYLYNKK